MITLVTGFLVTGLMAMQVGNPKPADEQSSTAAGNQPIYRVSVVQRTIKAVNYGHRSRPTKVDLTGTVLVPAARGEAEVESRRGAVQIRVKVKDLPAPSTFGREYLTYVLWAITPEGRPANLGELVLDPSNEGKLQVSSELQSFALLVTAEPYFAVTQPSDVVVMENVIRPDTVGRIEEVNARYELLPRGHYTYVQPSSGPDPSNEREKVSMDQYEAIAALYQALNAIQIARAAGADSAAGDTMRKALELYEEARKLQLSNAGSRKVVMTARQAAQTAEDARAITQKRSQ